MGILDGKVRATGSPPPDRDIDTHVLSRPLQPDWESLIETGTVPALILGAERRLNRGR